MLLKFISYIPAILGLFAIGSFVYFNNPKNIKSKAFGFLTLTIGMWLLSLFVGDTTQSNYVALWALRSGLFFGQLMFLAFFYFAIVFPFRSEIRRRTIYILSVALVVTAVLLLTNLGVSTVSIKDFGVQPEEIGPLYTVSDILGLLYMLAGIGILLFKYRRSNIQEKNQIKFVLFGLSVAIIVNVFTGLILTLLKVETDVILFGSFSLFIFALFVAYTIVKHGFLDVRLIVARTVGYALTVATIAGVYAVLLFGLLSRVIGIEQVSAAQQLLYIAFAVFFSLTFQSIKRFFDKLSNKLFYRDAYEPQVLLNELNNLLVSSIDLNKILEQSAQTILTHLKAEYVLFRINRPKGEGAKSVAIGELDKEKVDTELDHIINKVHKKIVVAADEIEENEALSESMLNVKVSVITKMMSSTQHGTAVGYLVLGQKRSGNLYNTQDIRIINIIADELVLAVQNALRFEEIQQFNITLQQKVDDATHKLRAANERLKALDETKDEFISMASHQLRTPLTTVKGYLSMVLEGDAGKISQNQHKLLDQSFLSAQRMVYLIADLLNVSRLRTGKFVIDAHPTNLADLVEGELAQLTETAKSRNLTLKYDKPKNFPSLMLDETKIRQVVMNFADNAIYYTPAGGHININLVDKPESVEFTVVDDGIGVPKSEQHHLFSKFYRAGNAKKARPDGTGLGLFMAQKVIVAQGGAIIFHSEEGKGSTFGFTFAKDKLKVDTKAGSKKDNKPSEPGLL